MCSCNAVFDKQRGFLNLSLATRRKVRQSKASLAFFLAKPTCFTQPSATTLAMVTTLWMNVAAIHAMTKSALAKLSA